MHRRFSSNTSINLIELDGQLDTCHRGKCNSLVEMFDPIFDKQFQNSSDQLDNSMASSSSSDDIFATSTKIKITNAIATKTEVANDELFQDFKASENKTYESIYPSLSTFKTNFSNERYSLFVSLPNLIDMTAH